MTFTVETYASVGISSPARHPQAQVWLPPGYTLTGGGAYDIWQGQGNLLTASYPIRQNDSEPYTGWAAAGKDQKYDDPAPLAVYAIGIRILDDKGNPVNISQHVSKETSSKESHPGVQVKLPDGWLGTGGGAVDNWSGYGNLLTASCPLLDNGNVVGWKAEGKEQGTPDPSTITAYVIGIQVQGATPDIDVTFATGAKESQPSASVMIPAGNSLVGGGAIDNWTGQGNLLTATYPIIDSTGRLTGWQAHGKEHMYSDPSTITVYAISIEL